MLPLDFQALETQDVADQIRLMQDVQALEAAAVKVFLDSHENTERNNLIT